MFHTLLLCTLFQQTRVDLARVYLVRVDLARVDLARVDLARVYLVRVDHMGVDFVGIDLVAPNPCFVKYVHHSQHPNQHNLLDSGACITKTFHAPHFVTVVSWWVGVLRRVSSRNIFKGGGGGGGQN